MNLPVFFSVNENVGWKLTVRRGWFGTFKNITFTAFSIVDFHSKTKTKVVQFNDI
jgi:hypothetical protein